MNALDNFFRKFLGGFALAVAFQLWFEMATGTKLPVLAALPPILIGLAAWGLL